MAIGKGFGETTMHLTLDDHRVNAGAAIIQRVEAPCFGNTRVDVDIHDTEIGAERIGHVGRVIIT
jgi:hypothetical protein